MERSEFKQFVFLIGTVGAVYLSFRYLLPLVVPFIFSYFIAKLMYPAAVKLKKRFHISGGISGSLLVGGITCSLGLLIFGIIQILFGQMKNFVRNLPRYQQIAMIELNDICERCDSMFGLKSGSFNGFVSTHLLKEAEEAKEEMLSLFSTETIQSIIKIFGAFWIIFLVLLGAYFIIKDMEDLKIIFEESIFYKIGNPVLGKLGEIGFAYGKAELIIIIVDAIVCLVGLLLMGKENAFLTAVGISIFDALPVLGCGFILIPWSILMLIRGYWYHGAILFTIYAICQIIREIIEAKIIGKGTGIKPIYSLISMYVGVKLFGILGFILGPIAYVIIKSCIETQSL